MSWWTPRAVVPELREEVQSQQLLRASWTQVKDMKLVGGGGSQNLVGYPLRILKLRRLVIDEVERRAGSFVILGGMEFKECSLWFRVSE